MARVFIIHGWQGNPQEGWKPWLKAELEKKGFEVYVPALPNPNDPVCEEWIACIKETVGKPRPSDIFVGHSLGCIAILKYLETIRCRVRACIFVAGFLKSIGYREHDTFFTKSLQWKIITANCSHFTAIFSDNDAYVPLDSKNDFQKHLGAKIIVEHDMHHFDGENRIVRVPGVLRIVAGLEELPG